MTREQFAERVAAQSKPPWLTYLVLHNSGAPNMRQARNTPGGFKQRIKNLEHYYKNQQRWSAGPHGFIFEDGLIYEGTPLVHQGTHSPSFNRNAYGFEMMADFRPGVDDPMRDGGLLVYDTAAFAFATICKQFGLSTDAIKLHKEDPRTTHDCPGSLVKKPAFIEMVRAYMADEMPDEEGHSLGWQEQIFDVWEIQSRLAFHGFDPGPLDGWMGPKTDAGIMEAQKALGVAEDGLVGPWVMGKLRGPLDFWSGAKPSAEPVGAPLENDRPRWAINILESVGWKPHQAKGAVGNFQRESYPTLRSGAAGDRIGGEATAFGIAQWRLDRFEALKAFATARGQTWDDFETQVLFVPHELKTSEKLAGKWLERAETVEQATAAMVFYERPAGYISSAARAADTWDDVMRVAKRCDGWAERLAFAKAL